MCLSFKSPQTGNIYLKTIIRCTSFIHKESFYAAMVDPQLKKDTARQFYSYPFLWNIYSLSQGKLKYKRKNDELIEQNKTTQKLLVELVEKSEA